MEIELADAVAAVRDELLDAAVRRSGRDVVFAVTEVVLEFAVELRQDTTARAGFKAWVASAEGSRTAGRGSTHRVSVTLAPRTGDGDEVLGAGDEHRAAGPGDVEGHLGR